MAIFYRSYGPTPEAAEAWIWVAILISLVIGFAVGFDAGAAAATYRAAHIHEVLR